jgi:hypothetical protein
MWRLAALCLLLATFSAPAEAKPYKTNPNSPPDRTELGPSQSANPAKFSAAERHLIRAELLGRGHQQAGAGRPNLPPGLQKKSARGKSLPPGWQSRLIPGHSLDYQVYRQGEHLPDNLLRRLAPPPVGSEIVRIEDRIIRLHSATRTILDVFDLTP